MREIGEALSTDGYELEVDERFDGDELDRSLWYPHYLPQWSSRELSAARYDVGGGRLRLRVDADQPAWCPDLDGELRVSSLQTGVFAGPVGSPIGQHRFNPAAIVREAQENVRLYTPTYGLFEMQARANDDPSVLVALWMIGYEDEPERSAEICVFEIFGRDVRPGAVAVGMGLHPFGDPRIVDDFEQVRLPIDAREPHTYAVEWAPGGVAYFVDGTCVKVSRQAPDYPMQFMLNVYAFPAEGGGPPPGPYPKEFVVDRFRAYGRR